MSYLPLKCKTHYSLQESLIKPDKLADELDRLGYNTCAITDIASISGAVEFSSALQNRKDKPKIKPILGTEVLIKDSSNKFYSSGTIALLAKNKKGWSNLIKLTSESNNKENMVSRFERDTPMLALSALSKYDNLICMVGHQNTILANILFTYPNVYFCQTKEEIASYLNPNAIDEATGLISLLKDIFGKENLFIEVQRTGDIVANYIADIMQELAVKTGTKVIAASDPHYLQSSPFNDHKLWLTSLVKSTNGELELFKYPELAPYFNSYSYALPSKEQIALLNTEEEIKNTSLIGDMCESYTITGKPRTPNFPCPNNLSEIEYLRELCRDGYRRLHQSTWDKEVYGDRVKKELAVIEKAGLAGYFLIVQDYVNWARQRMLVGPARGSSCGSLVSYLTNITNIDPIPYHLIFERFYNEGRNTADHISFPDIDVDFPMDRREEVIEYIRQKYGHDKVAHIATFGRSQGRGALKEVLRIHMACDENTMNLITKDLPDEHEIADKLEDSGEESIIKWTLENEPEAVSEYVKLDNGVITGDYAQYFEQAIRLEGTYKSQGKHAAGIVISADVLAEVCPMLSDKSSDEKIAGMEMESVEKLGYLKMDILSLAALDKISLANDLIGGK